MLVLSRKEGERISIGENITLVISKIEGNRVAIGIEAPRQIKVVRGELSGDIVSAKADVPPSRESSPARKAMKDFVSSATAKLRHVG
jgi:carbon storage regulator